MSKAPSTNIGKLILMPAIITLALTLLRLVGELQHWSHGLFNPEAGGGGALIGISWLPLIFGIYFALKLMQAGDGPTSPPRAIVNVLAGIMVIIVGGLIWSRLQPGFYGRLLAFCVMFIIAAAIQYLAWPALCKTLFAYALAARIPVAILMFFAMQGNWGTHYDVVPPGAPEAMNAFWPKYIWLALLPQLFIWVGFTVVTGSLTGSITAALARRGKVAEQAASPS